MTAFPSSMTPTQFVDQLNHNADDVLTATERATAINLFAARATPPTARRVHRRFDSWPRKWPSPQMNPAARLG
jgi:hypothetical protein